MMLRCLHKEWLGRGWSSNTFDEKVPRGYIRVFYECADCGERKYEDKALQEVEWIFKEVDNDRHQGK